MTWIFEYIFIKQPKSVYGNLSNSSPQFQQLLSQLLYIACPFLGKIIIYWPPSTTSSSHIFLHIITSSKRPLYCRIIFSDPRKIKILFLQNNTESTRSRWSYKICRWHNQFSLPTLLARMLNFRQDFKLFSSIPFATCQSKNLGMDLYSSEAEACSISAATR